MAISLPLRAARDILARWDRFIHWFFKRTWPSYLLISALQLKVLWRIWDFKDLTSGDTSSYFGGAYRWYESFNVDLVWSPLYTAFYGSVFTLMPDVYAATIIHRVLIVMVATLGVL